MLENRLLRAAFTSQRLEAVRLIAAQLAVSLDNPSSTPTCSRLPGADRSRGRRGTPTHRAGSARRCPARIVSLILQLRAAQAAVAPELTDRLAGLAEEANGALEELREIARGIHPAVLAGGGLRPALGALARRSAVPVDLSIRVDERLPESIEIAVYYVVAEALTNATKHAQASIVTVHRRNRRHAQGPHLRVSVRDDGRGATALSGGSGLLGLQDRVETLGGGFTVRSTPGSGTTVQAEIPV